MSSSTFSQIRQQVLNLENNTESHLSKLSQYISNSQLQIDAEQEEINLITKINDLFDKRDTLISKLNRINETDSNLSTSKLQQLSRHKEILQEHKYTFTRLKNSIDEERNKNNLLNTVQNDLRQKRQSELNSNDYINDESERVGGLNSIADRLLSSAYLTRDELLSQRQFLNNAQSNILNSLQSVPGLNVLISKINTRKKRDTLIIATVIAVCIIFLFFV